MRARALFPVRTLALALALAPALGPLVAANHGEEPVPYLDASGRFLVGLVAIGVGDVNLARATFDTERCHGRLQILLDYAPRNASVAVEKGYVATPWTFQLRLFDAATNASIATTNFQSPGAREIDLGDAYLEGGSVRADLYMLQGADVSYTLKVRGWTSFACSILD